jgi:hypothetical protein
MFLGFDPALGDQKFITDLPPPRPVDDSQDVSARRGNEAFAVHAELLVDWLR